MIDTLACGIPLFPLVACLLTATLGPRVLKSQSHWPAIVGCGLSAACSVLLLLNVGGMPEARRDVTLFQWMSIPGGPVSEGAPLWPAVDLPIVLGVDALAAVMLSMLTFVAALVAIYASGYMHGDRGYWRFFTLVSLFVFNMIMLVLSANFVQLFIFWEGVGLCSYGLIGYWYEKPEAAAAGMKAFVVNRVGDFGFSAGVFLVWMTFGTVSFTEVFEKAPAVAAANPVMLTVICLCLFAGACGKSAQFPLHVWLPDAMEGPTPVSALIHAATMVTAGVYLVARCTPLYMLAPQAQLTVSFIGAFTALLAALIALTQTDLKRVLAYSTVSQLGFMFLGLGAGSKLGIAAAMFHLVTHAFFKALLFLGAGSVMHSMGGVIDMQRFSGLKAVMPYTRWTFLAGSLALAGLAPLSGFWSKDAILSAVHSAAVGDHHGSADVHAVPPAEEGETPAATSHGFLGLSRPTSYLVLFWMASLTAGLTAFYTFRAYFMTFHGELKIPPEAGSHGHDSNHGHDHERGDGHGHGHGHGHAAAIRTAHGESHSEQGVAHESPPSMTVSLMILAVGALVLGAIVGHATHLFDNYLDKTVVGLAAESKSHATDWMVVGLSQLFAVAGIGLAFVMYGQPSGLPTRLAKAAGGLALASRNRFYFDELYSIFIVLPLTALAQISRFLDWYVVDGLLIGGVSQIPGRLFGRNAQPLQNGLVQFYALTMVLGVAVLLTAILMSPMWQG